MKMLKYLFVLAALFVVVATVGANNGADRTIDSVDTITDAADLSAIAKDGEARYIIQLDADSVANYAGGVDGYAATSPGANGTNKLDARSPAAEAYRSYVQQQQADFLADVSGFVGRAPEVTFQMQTAINAVVLTLSAEEAAAVAKLPNVKAVELDVAQPLATDVGPAWIGAPSIWDGTATAGAPGTTGAGIVVGVMDTGINSGHPSFAEVGGDGFADYASTNPFGPGGVAPGSWCDTDDPSFCNNKLIGAWDYSDGITDDPIGEGPEDNDGHGSHVASTAAGNVVDATLFAPTTDLTSTISGVAPHAHIIAYDVCGNEVGCFNSSVVAAIDQSILDGVDVLQESIGIGGETYSGSKQQAYLGAFNAGIVTSRSAGNSGPGFATVGPEPVWTMSSGASTHNRALENSLVDMTSDSATLPDIKGAGFTIGYGPAPIVYAGDYVNPNDPGNDPAQCLQPFPAGTFSGEIVICDRGSIARVAKGQHVLDGGAGGYVLANAASNGEAVVADGHFLPGVHVGYTDGVILKDWVANNPNTMATITGVTVNLDPVNGDVMAAFSSRGPLPPGVDVLKPDVTNPGVSIWAAIYNVGDDGVPDYGFKSGTSMSGPHTAGAAALLVAVHPDWSAAEIRSAMTSSGIRAVLEEDGATQADPFEFGGGRVDLTAAAEVGLVLDESGADFAASDPDMGGDPRTLNLATMQDSNCYQTCSWTRTFRNVSGERLIYDVQYVGDGAGTVSPGMGVVPPDAEFSITFTVDLTLEMEGWKFGYFEISEVDGKVADQHFTVAAYASNTTNAAVVNKTASNSVQDANSRIVYQGDTINYEVVVTNPDTEARMVTVVDQVPDGVEFVPTSEGGGFVYDPSTNSLSFTGELAAGGSTIDMVDGAPGYFSLASLGVSPFGFPSNPDDGCWGVTLPLPFEYLGDTYTNVIYSVNGALQLGQAGGACASPGNAELPDAGSPPSLLAPWWTDLDGTDSGELYVALLNGTWTVFEWEAMPRWGDASSVATFQVWLEHPTGVIYFSYDGWVGSTNPLTIGAQNSDGSVGMSRYFDGAGSLPTDTGSGIADVVVLAQSATGEPAVLTYDAIATGYPGQWVINEAVVTDDMGGEERADAVSLILAQPTAVEMAGMDAFVNADGSVTVSWETAAEVDNSGFMVLRSDSADAVGSALNSELIASTASAGAGAAYSFVDTTAGTGTYYYWVQAIATDGTTQEFGPAVAITEAPTSTALSSLGGNSNLLLPALLVGLLAVALLGGVLVNRREA